MPGYGIRITPSLEAAQAIVEAGVDIVASTLSGYTAHSPATEAPDFDLVERLAAALEVLNCPVIAEGASQCRNRHGGADSE